MAALYLDSSSLLKVFWDEPESHAVRVQLESEQHVVISPLAELEAEVQLRSGWLGGEYSHRRYLTYRQELESLRLLQPFAFPGLAGTVFSRALEQHRKVRRMHCRPLDRLHLAAMEDLGVGRLMTHDHKQGDAARALGLDVITPG